MNDQVTGIILKQVDFKEYDAIITVLTKELGKVAFRASGIRKMTSKNASSLMPYSKAEIQFDYVPGKTIFRLKTSRVISLNRHIQENLEASYSAGVLTCVADAFSLQGPEFEEREEVYACLDQALDLLNQGKDCRMVVCCYLVEMMQIFGIQPEVDGCVKCGSPLVQAISAQDGGFLCSEHAQMEGIPLRTSNELKRFRFLVKAGLKHIDLVEQVGGVDNLDVLILEQMIQTHGLMNFNQFKLFNRLFTIE